MLLDLKALKACYKNFLVEKWQKVEYKPKLLIIQIGANLASQKYAEIKEKVGAELGIQVYYYRFLANGRFYFQNKEYFWKQSQTDLDYFTSKLSQELQIFIENNLFSTLEPTDGLIFQLPVPEYFSEFIKQHSVWQKVCDVDFLSSRSTLLWQQQLLPPTIQAIDLVLKQVLQTKQEPTQNSLSSQTVETFLKSVLDLSTYHVCVLGQGQMVGKPLLKYLVTRQANFSSLNQFSLQTKKILSLADIVISAVGKAKFLDPQILKKEALFLDVGTSEVNGSLVGDLNYDKLEKLLAKVTNTQSTTQRDNLSQKTLVTNTENSQSSTISKVQSLKICPSPGGIGPFTVLSLFYNLLLLQKR